MCSPTETDPLNRGDVVRVTKDIRSTTYLDSAVAMLIATVNREREYWRSRALSAEERIANGLRELGKV